jgi:hypothetical protein
MRRSGCSEATPYPPGGQAEYTLPLKAEKAIFTTQNDPPKGARPARYQANSHLNKHEFNAKVELGNLEDRIRKFLILIFIRIC